MYNVKHIPATCVLAENSQKNAVIVFDKVDTI